MTDFGMAARSMIRSRKNFLQFLLRSPRPRFKLYVENRKFAGKSVRPADGGGELDGRVLVGGLFDDGGIDIVAATNDQILQPAGDPKKTVPIDATQIAGPEPAVSGKRAGTVVDDSW